MYFFYQNISIGCDVLLPAFEPVVLQSSKASADQIYNSRLEKQLAPMLEVTFR